MYAKKNISCTKNLKKIISDPSFLEWHQISVPIFHLYAYSDLHKKCCLQTRLFFEGLKFSFPVAFTHTLEISGVGKGNLYNFSLNLFSFDFPTYKV